MHLKSMAIRGRVMLARGAAHGRALRKRGTGGMGQGSEERRPACPMGGSCLYLTVAGLRHHGAC